MCKGVGSSVIKFFVALLIIGIDYKTFQWDPFQYQFTIKVLSLLRKKVQDL